MDGVNDIDSALARVGGYRRWNLAMYFLLAISFHIPLCWHGLSIVFVGWEPPHVCTGSKSFTESADISYLENLTAAHLWSNISDHNQTNLDPRCYFERHDFYAEKCNKWRYTNEGYDTVVEQWDLVCDKNYLAELSQTLYQLGSLVGELLSFVVDKYGRKKLHIITHLLICIVGVVNAYSVSYPMFAMTKAIGGMFIAINLTSGVMLLLEFFDSRHRTMPGIMLQCFWTLCYVLLPGMAYFIKNWVNLQLAISLISPIFACLTFLIPESPLWLLSKGETKKAVRILENIAKWNNVELDGGEKLLAGVVRPSLELVVEKQLSEVTESSGLPNNAKSEDVIIEDDCNKDVVDTVVGFHVSDQTGDILKPRSKFRYLLDPVILKYLAISSSLWFSTCLVFYGLILATPSLEGNRFLNFVLLGLVEWPATLLASLSSKRVGRRMTSSVTLFVAGCCVAVIIFIPKTDAMIWMNLTFVIVSKGFVSATFAVMILYTKEIFPTYLRATCCGICQIWGRIGALLAPMAAYMIKTNLFWVPNILFGVVSVIVSFLVLFLPETNNQPLPETVEDCHKLNANKFFSRQNRR